MLYKRKLGRFWQVREGSFTITQFMKETDVDAFIRQSSNLPTFDLGIGNDEPSKKSYLVKRINLYP